MSKKQLVLDFTSVTGIAREAISTRLQHILFALGCTWPTNSAKIENTDNKYLVIISGGSSDKYNEIRCSDGNIIAYLNRSHIPFEVFNVTSQTEVSQFLNYIRPQERTIMIDGIKVTVKRDHIKFDSKNLLRSVGEKAKKLQADMFAC